MATVNSTKTKPNPLARGWRYAPLSFKRGARAFREGKKREDNPYNGEELRAEWIAGYEYAVRVAIIANGI
jgi:ribosome modulation factor